MYYFYFYCSLKLTAIGKDIFLSLNSCCGGRSTIGLPKGFKGNTITEREHNPGSHASGVRLISHSKLPIVVNVCVFFVSPWQPFDELVTYPGNLS